MTALREGFTTGTAAAAAAYAAARVLAGEPPSALSRVRVELPAGGTREVAVEFVRPEGDGARAGVRKDGGDDPDATHGAMIEALVTPRSEPGVVVDGGRGVGRVTREGLPVDVGRAAINPTPRRQIAQAATAAWAAAGGRGGLNVLIEVPEGERIAAETLNPRLGILGGISILGRSGTVRPYSHAAWAAAVRQALAVARRAGLEEVWLTTGRESERLLRALRPDLPELPELAMIQAADHAALALRTACHLGFARATWALFCGKLAKQAQGLPQTHAHHAPLDFAILAEAALQAGCTPDQARSIQGQVTARGAFAVLEPEVRRRLAGLLAARARHHAGRFVRGSMAVDYLVFDADGSLLHAPEYVMEGLA